MKYEYLDHTADAKFRAYGNNMQEAFGNAVEAMFNVMTDTEKIKPLRTLHVHADGTDLQALLVHFLEEFVFLLDTENFLLHQIKNVEITQCEKGWCIAATAIGDTYNREYITQSDVKAITYNDMIVDEDKNMVQVVVDI